MARSIVYLGSNPFSTLESWLAPAAMWPDIDRQRDGDGNPILGVYGNTKLQTLPRITALCLAPNTDWDYCLIRFQGEQDWKLCGPGILLRPDAGEVGDFEVKPYFRCPSTRLYDATLLRQSKSGFFGPTVAPASFAVGSPLATGGWAVSTDGSFNVYNHSAAGLQAYSWNGYKWAAYAVVAAGANLVNGANPVSLYGAIGPDSNRAADYSPDGIWSFAEYWLAGLLLEDGILQPAREAGQYVRASTVASPYFDPRGNPGDPTNNSTVAYVAQWAGPSARWFGKLAVEIFHDGERPGPAYRPMLAVERVVTIGGLTIPTAGAAPQVGLTVGRGQRELRGRYRRRRHARLRFGAQEHGHPEKTSCGPRRRRGRPTFTN